MTPQDLGSTQEKILDAAERLFAEQGFAASLRDITNAAAANVAAVSYHFGGKEGLFRAVFARRLRAINMERLKLLTLAEAAAGDSSPTLESIIHAFVEPTFRYRAKCPDFMRLVFRLHAEKSDLKLEIFADSLMEELVTRFRGALIRSFPETDPSDMWWGMAFVLGAMFHSWDCSSEITHLSKGEAVYGSDEEMVDRLVCFASAGMRAIAREGELR